MVMLLTSLTNSLFAQSDPWWEMGRRFREGGTALEPANVGIFLGCLAGLTVLIWLVARYVQRDGSRPFNGPRRLFWQLCRAHQLDLRESWLLWKLARGHGLRQPAQVFIEAQYFNADTLPNHLRRQDKVFVALRKRLFE